MHFLLKTSPDSLIFLHAQALRPSGGDALVFGHSILSPGGMASARAISGKLYVASTCVTPPWPSLPPLRLLSPDPGPPFPSLQLLSLSSPGVADTTIRHSPPHFISSWHVQASALSSTYSGPS